jgi:hypothetical protein
MYVHYVQTLPPLPQSTHRVATAAFWRKFRHDEEKKSALAGEGGGCTLTRFTLFTTTYKVAVYAQIHSLSFISTPMYSVVQTLPPSTSQELREKRKKS